MLLFKLAILIIKSNNLIFLMYIAITILLLASPQEHATKSILYKVKL